MSLQSRLNNLITAIGADIKSLTSQLNGITSVPTGVILPFGGDVAPAGFILAQGQIVSRAAYPGLWNAYGTKYGAGNNDGLTFTLPNPSGRFLRGGTPGGTGGSTTKTLTAANLPPHAHAIDHDHPSVTSSSSGSHQHNLATTTANTGAGNYPSRGSTAPNVATNTAHAIDVQGAHTHEVDIPAFTGSSGNGPGSSTPFDVTNPYLDTNYIIKT